jgi:hypothetical protein
LFFPASSGWLSLLQAGHQRFANPAFPSPHFPFQERIIK